MKFLEELGFSPEVIAEIKDNTPDKLLTLLEAQKKLIAENINYLKNLGITNYQEIFVRYYDIFLMDSSNFRGVFDKYDPVDLVAKLQKNINVVEYL